MSIFNLLGMRNYSYPENIHFRTDSPSQRDRDDRLRCEIIFDIFRDSFANVPIHEYLIVAQSTTTTIGRCATILMALLQSSLFIVILLNKYFVAFNLVEHGLLCCNHHQRRFVRLCIIFIFHNPIKTGKILTAHCPWMCDAVTRIRPFHKCILHYVTSSV